MKVNILLVLFCLSAFFANGQNEQNNIPHLIYKNGCAELVVDGRPILMRAGELGNSSASSIPYMKPIWPRLLKMHLNTLIIPVYWELLEPHEGKFDFSLVDALVADAGGRPASRHIKRGRRSFCKRKMATRQANEWRPGSPGQTSKDTGGRVRHPAHQTLHL